VLWPHLNHEFIPSIRVVRDSALRTWKLLQRTGNGAAELSHELYVPAVFELGEERAVMFHNVSRLLTVEEQAILYIDSRN